MPMRLAATVRRRRVKDAEPRQALSAGVAKYGRCTPKGLSFHLDQCLQKAGKVVGKGDDPFFRALAPKEDLAGPIQA